MSQLRLREAGERQVGYEKMEKENEKVKSEARSYLFPTQPQKEPTKSMESY